MFSCSVLDQFVRMAMMPVMSAMLVMEALSFEEMPALKVAGTGPVLV